MIRSLNFIIKQILIIWNYLFFSKSATLIEKKNIRYILITIKNMSFDPKAFAN